MKPNAKRSGVLAARVGASLTSFIGDRRANVLPLVALMLIPLIGMLGLAGEVSSWFLMNRGMQNAADSAVVASATAGADGNTSYLQEALSVTSNYSLANGVNNVVVTGVNNAACPDGSGSVCYQVSITRTVPLELVGVVGYRATGHPTLNGAPAQIISATSIAELEPSNATYCLLSLDSKAGDDGILTNGAPKADLQGCVVRSNSNATCHGSNLNATASVAVGKITSCGNQQFTGSVLADPYKALATNIPANTCSPAGSKTTYTGTTTQAGGSVTWPATKIVCGNLQLTGNVNLTTASPGTVLVIENGDLNFNGFTLKTLAGSGLTIIFTGPTIAGLSPSHFPIGSGTLDAAAPTSGTWSGVVIYQDPNLPSGSGVDLTAAGNSPTWNLTGLVYLPNSVVTLSGAVNKASNGAYCFSIVDFTFRINGTASIFKNSQLACSQAGLVPPSGVGGLRAMLVQ